MSYYLYISATKVDMLLPRVPGAISKKVAARLGFDLKVITGQIETERKTPDTLIAQLANVEQHIEVTEDVGTLQKPQAWISGESPAKITVLRERPGVVFFIIETSDTILAMGGSSKHLISKIETNELDSGYSFAPTLLDQFIRIADDNPRFLVLPDYRVENVLDLNKWERIVADVARRLSGVEQRVSFLAKRLLEGEYVNKKVILATPLHVSLVD